MNSETFWVVRPVGGKTVADVSVTFIDFRNAEPMKRSLAGLIHSGKSQLLLNLEKVSFMDSSGLSVILYAKRLCDEVHGDFSVCGLQSYLKNLATITNLNRSINIYATEQEALKSSV